MQFRFRKKKHPSVVPSRVCEVGLVFSLLVWLWRMLYDHKAHTHTLSACGFRWISVYQQLWPDRSAEERLDLHKSFFFAFLTTSTFSHRDRKTMPLFHHWLAVLRLHQTVCRLAGRMRNAFVLHNRRTAREFQVFVSNPGVRPLWAVSIHCGGQIYACYFWIPL